MNYFKKSVLSVFIALIGVVVLTNFAFSREDDQTIIKFASLAPEGSTWMNIMHEWNKELMDKSKGKMTFKIYAGGLQGDEKDVVRKIRLGQLQSGGFTGVGMGEIAPDVRVL